MRLLMKIFSPYGSSQIFKFLALIGILGIIYFVRHWVVASIGIFILGTFIASEAFILMLARSMFKNPTDENVVKLFMVLLFKNEEQANKILDQYKKPE